jgi:transcriptional regulator
MAMYKPPAFRNEVQESLIATIQAARLANFVTATPDGPLVTPLPLFIDEHEGERGVIYVIWRKPIHNGAHHHWASIGCFQGPDACITPSWYALKQETGKVVPTWNYFAVHAHGPVEFFEDTIRLLDVVRRLTELHEGDRSAPWAVADAPPDFIQAQLASDCRIANANYKARGYLVNMGSEIITGGSRGRKH